MKYTLQYIPISKIKPDKTPAIARHLRNWRKILWDCMHLMAVRKSRKGGGYVIIGGHDRYEHVIQHTRRKAIPCLIDEGPVIGSSKRWLSRSGDSLRRLASMPMTPTSWRIIRTFLRQEPRFRRLPLNLQMKLLWMGARYRRTAVEAMKAEVEEWNDRNRLLS